MILEQDIEIGEFYRDRTTQKIYVIILINNNMMTYLINTDTVESSKTKLLELKASTTVSYFKNQIKKGEVSRLGKLTKPELAKYLLQR